MSWMHRLVETYDNCEQIAGLIPPQVDEKSKHQTAILLPIGHTLLKAHVTVKLDENGLLLGAEAFEDHLGTVAPSTEDSESRSSTMAAPHPLYDKLQYLAGDFETYTGVKNERYYQAYLQQIKRWCDSDYTHPKVEAIYKYLQKGQLIGDLVEKKILYLDENGRLLDKWNGSRETAPEIFKIANCTPSTVVVRFTVNQASQSETRVWMDEAVRRNYIDYTLWQQSDTCLCYVSGKIVPFIEKHPKKIVNTLANAKLISANDTSGYTFRGRFTESKQAVCVGYDSSLKAHNALRWLVESRGVKFDSKVILAWETSNNLLPSPVGDSDDLFGFDDVKSNSDLFIEVDSQSGLAFSRKFRDALLSRRYQHLDSHGDAVVMALDSATVGRLSITYYREMKSGEYIEQLANWHSTCLWLHRKYSEETKISFTFIGAPSFKEIGNAVYGRKGSETLKKSVSERLLPCIFDGAQVPDDLVYGAVRRASNPVALDFWEWNRILSIACALYKKQHEKEAYHLALEENRTDRNYLFGRLLAVADQIEKWALEGEDRETNAMRYMNALSKKPVETWRVISERLQPYQMRLKSKATRLNDLITRITAQFEPGDFDTKPEKPLTGAYLLGYHNQRQVFLNEWADRKKQAEENKLNNIQIIEEK